MIYNTLGGGGESIHSLHCYVPNQEHSTCLDSVSNGHDIKISSEEAKLKVK